MTRYRLFHELAHRYDWHTPPDHYRHDHAFVLETARSYPQPRLLDVGCGTGVLLRRAVAEGIAARGLDASPEMVAVCEGHLGSGVARVERMEELAEVSGYDVLSCLSWSLNYLPDEGVVARTLARFWQALRPGGTMILQVAHAEHATGEVFEDREAGPEGEADDVRMLYRFSRAPTAEPALVAQYVYACFSRRELVHEDHVLGVADARRVVSLAGEAGFREVQVYDSWRGDPFGSSVIPFVVARRPS